jgi:DNA polymerase-3 subunit delta'
MSALYPWQANDWQRLLALRERPPQGLMFKGAKGMGKLDLALNYAHSLLCERPQTEGLACGVCPACHWLSQDSHPDFRFLQPDALSQSGEESESGKKASKQITVEQVRGLADFLGMSSHQGGMRVIVICPAEAMNSNAANALLKNLEEPPRNTLFILVTHKPQQLLPTILSRCVSFGLAVPDTEAATQWLRTQKVSDPEHTLAAAGYSPLLALQGDAQVGADERIKLLNGLRSPASLDVFVMAELLQKTEQVLVVQWLQQWCYDLIAMKQAGSLRYHMGDEATIKQLVTPVAALDLVRLQKLLQTAKREAQHTLNPKLFFESLLLAYRQLLSV